MAPRRLLLLAPTFSLLSFVFSSSPPPFTGSGSGDAAEWLAALNSAYSSWSPTPHLQDVTQLYKPDWNSFVEGPTWTDWWTQNSYGPSFAALPFLSQPHLTWMNNSNNFWFLNIGDGHRSCSDCGGAVAPDGCLCDGASPTDCQYKQGDGDVPRHDWALEETLSAVIIQSEMLLISRDLGAASFYLPLFNRTLALIESRRDAATNLFLAGQSSNLLAPSYGAWIQADGSRSRAYLTGLSISYIAALDRVAELEALSGDAPSAGAYAARRAAALAGLPQLLEPEGNYFVKWMDPNGTLHGVLGGAAHAYIEAVANHDAVALGVAERVRAGLGEAIMASLTGARVPPNPVTGGPGLRPFAFVLTNAGGLDDMEAPDTSWLWQFGTWVNGGAWATCEARMIIAYARTGRLPLALESWRALMGFASIFRMDSPLVAWGSQVYQPGEPINTVYDMFGVGAGLLRALWDPVYSATELVLNPHVPRNFTALSQTGAPLYWGGYAFSVTAEGDPGAPITAVAVGGAPWPAALFSNVSVRLPWGALPGAPANVTVAITFGAPPPTAAAAAHARSAPLPHLPPQWLHPASAAAALRALRGAVPAGAALWLEAADLALPDGARVGAWPDASGSGADAAQGDPAARPIFFANGTRAGAPAVVFDGARTFLVNAGAPPTPAALTVVARFRDDGSPSACCSGLFVTNGTCLNVPDTNLSTGCLGLSTQAPGARLIIDYAGSTDGGDDALAGLLVTGAVVYNASGAFSFAEGCAQSRADAGVARPGLGYFVGTRGAFQDRFFKGALSALLVWPRALNDSERGAAEAYLAAKYPRPADQAPLTCSGVPANCTLPPALARAGAHLGAFAAGMRAAGFADARYELAHALLGAAALRSWGDRCGGLQNGTIAPLPSEASERAADALYQSTAGNLYGGLGAVIAGYAGSPDAKRAEIFKLWSATR
jgi:hypothetical protein